MKKFNKGEWSELYVFFSILADGKIYAADENLNRIEQTFYSVLKLFVKINHILVMRQIS